MTKLKNKLIAAIAALVMAAACLVGIGGTTGKKAYALSPDDPAEYLSGVNTIYYFTDCEATYANVVDGYNDGYYQVVYDYYPLVSSEELEFLIYTGYFWGFDQTVENLVVMDINSFKPSDKVLEELLLCLDAQGCKTMFVSPYMDYAILSNSCAYAYQKKTDFTVFVENCAFYMRDKTNGFQDPGILLLDLKYLVLNYNPDIQSEINIYQYSPSLRRLLLNLVSDRGDLSEGDIYYDAIKYYYENYLGLTVNGIPDIGQCIELWQAMSEDESINFSERWKEFITECEQYADLFARMNDYYSDIVNRLRECGFEIYIHISGDDYVDLIEMSSQNLYEKYPGGINEFIGGKHIFAIGVSTLESDYYSFLKKLQDNPDNYDYETITIFLWIVDPVQYGPDGLDVYTVESMEDFYFYEEPLYDDDELTYMFSDNFDEFLWG